MEPPIGPEFKLELQLPDATTPIAVLLGPMGSGKTMLMARLVHWLLDNGYTAEVNSPLQSSDTIYFSGYSKVWSREFMPMVHSGLQPNIYPPPFGHIMLITVRYGNGCICLLELPGHLFFDQCRNLDHKRLLELERLFHSYFSTLVNSSNPKIWFFFVESFWPHYCYKDDYSSMRRLYAERILDMEEIIPSTDKVVFICAKVDLHHGLFKNGQPDVPQFFKDIKNQYPGIFSKYEVKNPIVRLWRKYNCDFVAFSAGSFYMTYEGGLSYSPSKDLYPANLWKSITKNLRKMN